MFKFSTILYLAANRLATHTKFIKLKTHARTHDKPDLVWPVLGTPLTHNLIRYARYARIYYYDTIRYDL